MCRSFALSLLYLFCSISHGDRLAKILDVCVISDTTDNFVIDAIEEQLRHKHTKLLWEAILFQISKLQNQNKPVKIAFKEDEAAKECYGFASDYNIVSSNEEITIYVKYCKNEKKIFRPIVSYSLQTLMVSSVEIPGYICFSHELSHVLNILEYLNDCISNNKEIPSSAGEKILNGVNSYLATKMKFKWSLSTKIQQQEQSWGTINALDELSVIVGSKREISENSFVYLGETDFIREFYTDLSSKLEFFCWTHDVFETGDLNNLNKYKVVENILDFYSLLSYIRPFDLPYITDNNMKEIPYDTNNFQGLLPTCKQGTYEIVLGKFLGKIKTLKLILKIQQEHIKSKYYTFLIVLERKQDSLFFTPFEPEIENEIVIEKARIRLRNVAADGNCGIWALLQALYPDQNFIFPTEEQIQEMEQKRTEAANKCPAHDETKKNRIKNKATSASDLDHWLYTDDFRYFAQALGRPIGIIVYGDGYRIYEPNANEPNGNEIVYNNINDFRAYLKQHSGMPILCLAGNHYQAVINIKDLSLSTWLQK